METDVIVVGGGIAGLTAAVALSREGLTVTVLEKDVRLGGRAQSWNDRTTGDTIDLGPHIFVSEYPNFFELLELLGTRDRIVWQERGLFVHMVEGQKSYPYKVDHSLPTPLQFMPSLLKDERMTWLDTLSCANVTGYALRVSEEELRKLDEENALPFLKRWGVRPGNIERYWAFASMSIMNVPLEVCSAGALLRLHKRLIGSNDFQVGFAPQGLLSLFGGQAQAFIEGRGGQVRTSTGVKRFLVDGERVTGVELDDGKQLRARKVVTAVTPQVLRRLVPTPWLYRAPFEGLVKFVPCPYVSVYLWFDRKLTPLQFWARAFKPNDLNLDFYDLTNINPAWRGRPSLVASNIIYSHRVEGMSDQDIVQGTVRELAEYLPEAAQATLKHSVVNRIPMAIHCPYPGVEVARAQSGGSAPGLTLAGDWIDTGLPSSMESAARSGWQAAEAVLEEEGRPRTLGKLHRDLSGFAGWLGKGVEMMPHRVAKRMVRSARTRLRS